MSSMRVSPARLVLAELKAKIEAATEVRTILPSTRMGRQAIWSWRGRRSAQQKKRDLVTDRTRAGDQLRRLLLLLSRDAIQVVLEIDEGKERRHHEIQAEPDRLAPVVVIE